MPDKHFAYQFTGGDWEGWTPPWEQHGPWRGGPRGPWRGPRFGPRFFRRMFFGPGPFGPGGPGPFGPGDARRFFGRGDVKFVLLELLQERPMHGYEMMKALEQRSGGFYSPSAGTIYPTLQMLEEQGLVTVQEAEGKKIYSITDAGRQALAEHKKEEEEQFANPFWGRFGPQARRWMAPEMQALRSEAGEVARLFFIAGRVAFSSPAQLTRLHEILERTRKELSDLIYSAGEPKQDQGPQGPASSSPTTEQA